MIGFETCQKKHASFLWAPSHRVLSHKLHRHQEVVAAIISNKNWNKVRSLRKKMDGHRIETYQVGSAADIQS